MTPFQEFLTQAAVVFLYIGAVVWSVFPMLYITSDWIKTPYGRHLMRTSMLIAALLWGTIILNSGLVPLTVSLLIQVMLFGGVIAEGAVRIRLRVLALRLRRREAELARDALIRATEGRGDAG